MKPTYTASAYYRLTGILIISSTLLLVTSGCEKKAEPQKVAPAAQQSQATPKAPEPKPAAAENLAAKYEGKYLNKKYSHDFIELRKDGTFAYQEGKVTLAGKFFIQGTRLTLALPDGSGSVNTINDSGLTDGQGEIWKRK